MEHEEQVEQNLWNQLPGKSGGERAEILLELAKQAIYRSQGAEALALTQEAHAVYQQMGALAPTANLINAMTGISHSLYESGQTEEAIAVMNQVIDLQQAEHYPFVVDSMRAKASWLNELKQYQAAIDTYLEVVRINEIEDEKQFLAHDLYMIAHCYRRLENWEAAISHFEKSRENYKAASMFDEVAWCDAYLADTYAELKQSEIGADLAARTITFADIRNNNPLRCISHLALGKAKTVLGDAAGAEVALHFARSLAEESKEWDLIRRIEVAMLNLYQVHGNTGMAEQAAARVTALDEIISS